MSPLRIAQRSERRERHAQPGLGFLAAPEAQNLADIAADALHGRFGNDGADVVQHQAPDRRVGLCGEQHAEHAAHGGADPGNIVAAGRGDASDQRRHVGHVLRITVIVGVGQPAAFATTGDADADDTQIVLQHSGQRIEIAAVARQAVYADHHTRVLSITPIGVMQLVKAAAVQTLDVLLFHHKYLILLYYFTPNRIRLPTPVPIMTARWKTLHSR